MDHDYLILTPNERKTINLLFVEPEKSEQESLRAVMRTIGLGSFTFTAGLLEAIAAFDQRRFTHVIFPAAYTSNMPPMEFVHKVLMMLPTLVLVPASWNPDADQVFDLLKLGCRGYLCKPYTCESIEGAVVQATKGEPIAQAILDARDRNEAFAALLAGCLDRLATVQRQSAEYETARRELNGLMRRLYQSSQIARTFCRGGEDFLLEAIVEFFSNLANGPASKLGRLRKKLSTKRQAHIAHPTGFEGPD